MKILNKKGFTLVELLAVIVLLAIVAVVGIRSVMSMLNSSKRTTFVTTYNDVMNKVSNKAVMGEENAACSSGCESIYDISSTDYKLIIGDDDGKYTVLLAAKSGGTYNTTRLDAKACGKAVGIDVKCGTIKDDNTVDNGHYTGKPGISGKVEH